jgi:DNA-binding CsgD family transcriptional regulator
MCSSLSIQVYCGSKVNIETINFFETGNWSPESERELLTKIQDLLSSVRIYGKSFAVTIDMEVTNLDEAVFHVRKKMNRKLEVNSQKLSIREIEVLGLIMQGLTNHEIAERLFISYETVRSHRKKILEKTGAKNTAALINYYHQTFFEK